MKHLKHFDNFLKDTVNLNTTRLDLLDDSADAIKNFVRQGDWEPSISRFAGQGSWAHKTIIKPLPDAEYDADLLVFVKPVQDWTAKDYVKTLGELFSDSNTYADKSKVWDYCVTITYAGERKIDIAPVIINRSYEGQVDVCNKRTDEFEETLPDEYTQWMKDQNGYSGSNSFRKVTRLLKYLRDIKTRFTCPSVLLTTLLGMRISWLDEHTNEFADTPTALKVLMGRLDDWLQMHPMKPQVTIDALPVGEDLSNLWTNEQYTNFRDCMHRYRKWTDDAYDEEDSKESIVKWRRLFGEKFAEGVDLTKSDQSAVAAIRRNLLETTAAHFDGLVDAVKDWGISHLPTSFKDVPHMQQPTWQSLTELWPGYTVTAVYHTSRDQYNGDPVKNGDLLPPRGHLWFTAHGPSGAPISNDDYFTRWRITNTGQAALVLNKGRGEFNHPKGEKGKHKEDLQYRGVHLAEAFVVRRADSILVAQTEPFYVVIE